MDLRILQCATCGAVSFAIPNDETKKAPPRSDLTACRQCILGTLSDVGIAQLPAADFPSARISKMP